MECPYCKGTGFVEKDGVLELCSCRFEGADLQRLLNIPPRYIKEDFETYNPITPSQAVAKKACLAFAMSFDPKEGKGLTLVGPSDMGKTHLAVAILKTVYRTKRIRGLFFDTKDLLFRLQSSAVEGERYEKLMRAVLKVDLLVLDDLGNERLSEWRIETLSYIITHRYNYLKSTIITTNYPLRRTSSSTVGESLEERLSPSIVSKICQMGEVITLSP